MSNKKQKDPAFLFYPQDWIVGTQFMTNEQVGIYIRLLCFQHQVGHLPEKYISQICGGEIDAEVLAKFECDKEGKWYNQKLEDEMGRRKRLSDYQSKNASKRWDAKKDATKDAMAYAKDDAYAQEDAPRTETETVTETKAFKSKRSKTHVGETQTQTLKDPLEDLYNDL